MSLSTHKADSSVKLKSSNLIPTYDKWCEAPYVPNPGPLTQISARTFCRSNWYIRVVGGLQDPSSGQNMEWIIFPQSAFLTCSFFPLSVCLSHDLYFQIIYSFFGPMTSSAFLEWSYVLCPVPSCVFLITPGNYSDWLLNPCNRKRPWHWPAWLASCQVLHDRIKEDLVTTALRELIQIVCIHEIMVLRTLVNYRELVKYYLMYKTISDFTKDMFMSMWLHTCMCIWMGIYLCMCAYVCTCVYAWLGVYVHLYMFVYMHVGMSCAYLYVLYVYLYVHMFIFVFVGLWMPQIWLNFLDLSLLKNNYLSIWPHPGSTLEHVCSFLSFLSLHIFSHQRCNYVILHWDTALPQFPG